MYRVRHRLRFLLLELVSLAVAFLPAGARTIFGEAPVIKKQVPGYYRLMLGKLEVTALFDGSLDIDKNVLYGVTKEEINRLLAQRFIAGSKIPTSVNAYLVNFGNKLVLIDAGSGTAFGPTLGRLIANLKASGYEPAQVDAVLVTHLHGDHMGGLLDPSGRPTFVNATVYVPKADHDLWVKTVQTSESDNSKQKPGNNLASRIAASYEALECWKTFTPGQSPLPGIKTINIAGHTPGHAAFQIESEGQIMLFWGDLVHNMAVQLARSEVAVRYDANQRAAVSARQKLLKKLAVEKTLIAGAHMPFPGIGRIRENGSNGYIWVPVVFMPMAQ